MSKYIPKTQPPDQPQRERALDPTNSILVQAPAGSGKTDLLTRRFLRLLTEVQDPSQIVAITFTKAAAAEMRLRILSKLEAAASGDKLDPSNVKGFSPHIDPTETELTSVFDEGPEDEPFSMESLARRAMAHSNALGWNLLDQPAQLRISTIDSFCRDLALQQPLLSGLGDALGIYDQPEELYRRAARQALAQIDGADATLRSAIEALLLWRDNNWQEMESLIVEMLQNRDRWMHGFVLEREPDLEALRARLERPFSRAVMQSLTAVSLLLDQVPGSRNEALKLARFACEQGADALFQTLAELPDFPSDFTNADALEEAHSAYLCLAELLLTKEGNLRKQVNKNLGFPSDRKLEKAQILDLIERLDAVPGFASALAAVRDLPPLHYTDEDWRIVRACFTLLRLAAGQLRVVFAEIGAVDYTEVAQIALGVLQDEDGQPTEAAISVADKIHHILVDEFQDTSRRQHELLRRLIAAWPEREGRSCFVVGDPMQSIYFFRDADAELFPRVREAGLEIPNADPLLFDSVRLSSNFRSTKPLVEKLNGIFNQVFAANDGSGVTFTPADPAREESLPAITLLPEGAVENSPGQAERSPGEASRLRMKSPVGATENLADPPSNFALHINFFPQTSQNKNVSSASIGEVDNSQSAQIEEIVTLIRNHVDRIEQARAGGEKCRIAVLGRTRNVLAPIAKALRDAKIPFRAVDLEKLSARAEVLDALALARALLNPLDRVAWLGVLRAPWCGLSLSDLHTLTSDDDPALLARPVSELLAERVSMLSEQGRFAANRVLEALGLVPALRFAQPATSLGTWLEQVWLRLGGAQCVDSTAHANLDLLWQCFDNLPNGEQDLLASTLEAALKTLTAQPDPQASSNCGVQLMTIHKSKGLEFEVVIVPDLQAGSGKGKPRLLSWLERGLPPEDTEYQSDGFQEITEFLVAPLQSKGSDRGSTKRWVDQVYRQRESQETRRILYVAATRARNELHFFAQAACKIDETGDWALSEPKESLLKTAWPSLRSEIIQRFDEWKVTFLRTDAEPDTIQSLAASAESNLLVVSASIKPTILWRLPPDYRLTLTEHSATAQSQSVTGLAADQFYHRHEGGLVSRALGAAVHSLLESLSKLRKASDWQQARADLKQFQSQIAAQIRATGVDPSASAALAAEALRIALNASVDPIGNWILSPHTEDASEVRWTGVVAGSLRTVQVDRLFRGGLTPLSESGEAWWIIDYKSAHSENLNPAASLPQLRNLFAPQLQAYAQVLRNLYGAGAPTHAGLYYPRMMLFDWWEI